MFVDQACNTEVGVAGPLYASLQTLVTTKQRQATNSQPDPVGNGFGFGGAARLRNSFIQHRYF